VFRPAARRDHTRFDRITPPVLGTPRSDEPDLSGKNGKQILGKDLIAVDYRVIKTSGRAL
jgi:hypothetical protein